MLDLGYGVEGKNSSTENRKCKGPEKGPYLACSGTQGGPVAEALRES